VTPGSYVAVDDLGNIRLFRSAVDHATVGQSRTVCTSRSSTTMITAAGFWQSTTSRFVVGRWLTAAADG